MHATSVERCPSGKKKAPLAKRASVDDIAAYSIDVPDGEVASSYMIILCISSRFQFLVCLLKSTI